MAALVPRLVTARPLARPRLLSTAARHRPFGKQDALRLRVVGTGANVRGPANPGVRVEPAFFEECVELELAAEARELVGRYGYHLQGERATLAVGADGIRADSARRANNARVTGRYERLEQTCAPWGYGDDCDPEALPPAIRALAERLRAHSGYALGRLRDVTINARSDSFFQLDPHVDPPADGDNVFIANLLSSAVLTFTPAQTPPGLERRTDAAAVGERSWSDADVRAARARPSWFAAPRGCSRAGGAGPARARERRWTACSSAGPSCTFAARQGRGGCTRSGRACWSRSRARSAWPTGGGSSTICSAASPSGSRSCSPSSEVGLRGQLISCSESPRRLRDDGRHENKPKHLY